MASTLPKSKYRPGNPHTIIRLGAARSDVTVRWKGRSVTLTIRNAEDKVQVGKVLVELYTPHSPPVSNKERARRPSKRQPALTTKKLDRAVTTAMAPPTPRSPRKSRVAKPSTPV